MGSGASAARSARFGFKLSALGRMELGSSLSLRSSMRFDSALSLLGRGVFSDVLAAREALRAGRTVSCCFDSVQLGFFASMLEDLTLSEPLSVLNAANIDSTLFLPSFARSGIV